MIDILIAQAGLGKSVPDWVLVPAIAVVSAGWFMLYRFQRHSRLIDGTRRGIVKRTVRLLVVLIRVVLAFAAVWLTVQVIGKVFFLTTTWPIWLMVLSAVLLAEALVWLYKLERKVVSRRVGIVLTALRLTLLGLITLMLLQPVFASSWGKDTKRSLIVLVDDSASMHIADNNLSPEEKIRLAEGFSIISAQRPWHFQQDARALRDIRDRLMRESAWLDRARALPRKAAAEQLQRRRKVLHEQVSGASETIARQLKELEDVLQDLTGRGKAFQSLRVSLLDAKARLSKRVQPALLEALAETEPDKGAELVKNITFLRNSLNKATAAMAEVCPTLEKVGASLDELLYKRIAPADRATIDAVCKLDRFNLAVATLVHTPSKGKGEKKSIIDLLEKQYDVRAYTFAGKVCQTNLKDFSDPVDKVVVAGDRLASSGDSGQGDFSSTDSPDQAGKEINRRRTNLVGALRRALSEVGTDNLAGVVVLTDGQDNSQENVDPIGRTLGGAGASFCAILLGARRPPTDAAIVSIDAPETVYLSDNMFLNVKLKLDGMKGKTVSVALYDGKKKVDSRGIDVTSDVFREQVQLSDKPEKVGLHTYRVEVEKVPGEVFTNNNSYSLTISVTDDKTKVLLIDSLPRWEFRYLKNLFSGRDKTVRLQYVLTEPMRFEGQPPRKKIPASVSRPLKEVEATTFPANEEEWLKFDVIIIGDVPPDVFTSEDLRAIRKFVNDRGGTVVFVAGPRFMPGAYADTDLAELIPLRLEDSARADPVGRAGFRIMLTPVGKQHVIGRMHPDEDRSNKIWNSLPRLYWRSRYTQATPAGVVLAYAYEPSAPRWLTNVPGKDEPASTPQSLAKRREKYYRSHALITMARCGLGKVLMLSTDRTWRFRYRIGDPYHHRFWGQILRWATAGKLPAGTRLVKLGTDKTRYPPHSRPVVRARLVRADYSPVITNQIAVKIFRGEKCIGRVPMKYIKDSPGMYTAKLDELPAGTYRLELEGPMVSKLLAQDGAQKVSTTFSVDPSAPTEEVELAANRSLLNRLAALSHRGIVVSPWQARDVLSSLPPGKISIKHRREFLLWDSWLILVLFITVAAAEWILRKRVGLV